MLDKINISDYKSPTYKLIRFFKKSRDNWKRKYQDAKYQLKLKCNNIRYLKQRNSELKSQIKELKEQVQNLRSKKKLKNPTK
jgi:polyhydroxyalkanoate synthesis regulator phasin